MAGEKDWRPVFKSRAVRTERGKQIWDNLSFDTGLLCDGNENKQMKWEYYAARDSGNHKSLGRSILSINDFKKTKNMKTPKGTISATNFELIPSCGFLDYIFGGCKLNLTVAVDFTASNGD